MPTNEHQLLMGEHSPFIVELCGVNQKNDN